jgi:KUP system potassium uptake protein
MVLWFVSIGLVCAAGIVAEPGVLRASSPTYAISFIAAQPASAFFALAAVVLAITGAEALYADLGHFGRSPITLIASQAVITGAVRSLVKQFSWVIWPRLRILHTSSQTIGQIYAPYINWGLMIAVLALVLGSRHLRPWHTPSGWRSQAPSS